MNKLLLRQIGKYSKTAKIPEEFNDLLSAISETYNHFEKDRNMIERSIDLSSMEMIELNTELKREKEELMKIQNELKRNEFVLKQAQSISNIGSWLFDLSTYNAVWSDQMCLIFGLSVGENNQTLEEYFSFIHPEDLHFVKVEIEKSLKTLQNISLNTRIVRKDGTVRFVFMKSRFEFNLDGKPISKVGIIHDVTEIKKAEEKKQFSKRNLNALINNTNDLMWSLDKDFKLITANKPFYNLVKEQSGKSIERQGNVLETGFPPDEIEKFKVYYERAFRGEKFTIERHSFVPTEYWYEISFYPIYNDDGIIGTACFSRDITERKKAQLKLEQFTLDIIKIKNELEHSTLKLEQAQELAHIGSWELNLETRISAWSDEACRIYGVPLGERDKQSFKSWLSFIHPEDLDFVMQKVKEGQEVNKGASFQHRILRRDGSVRYIYSQSNLEYDIKGVVTGVYGVVQDITYQKLTEKKILEQNNELRALSNHLQHIREEERTHIAREIHDELGQQITALKMDISWIMYKQNNSEEAVVSKLQKMMRFTDDLIITIRRISSDLRPAIIDDLGLVAAIEWLCLDFERKTKISCSINFDLNERDFGNDFSIGTYRILQESLTNISRHAEAKSVIISVYEREDELLIEVVDDGKGISNENKIKGKTLGILGMKERAALLGGELIITSNEKKGTNLKLILPLKNENIVSR